MKEFDLKVPSAPARVALIAGRFNQFVTDELIAGARNALVRQGVDEHIPVLGAGRLRIAVSC